MSKIKWDGVTIRPKGKTRPLAVHIGRKIWELRESRQWSMRTSAEKCGVSLPFFCDMENGKQCPGAETLLKLSNGFDVAIELWFNGFPGYDV